MNKVVFTPELQGCYVGSCYILLEVSFCCIRHKDTADSFLLKCNFKNGLIRMSVCFVESLFTPIEGWPLLPTTCHWRMSYPSASTLLSWRVSCFHTLHLFANRLQSRPSDYLKITNVSYDMMVISLKHPDKSFSCCAFSSFLTRGTCGCG